MSEIPQGWAVTPLAELTDRITKGTTPKTYGHQFQAEGIRFVRAESLSGREIDHDKCLHVSKEAHAEFQRSQLQPADVLVTIAGTLGRIALVKEQDTPANTNQAVAICRPAEKALAPYIARYLEGEITAKAVDSGGRGTGLQNLNLKQVGEFEIWVPPLPEQRRIVAKLDRLSARSAAARDHLAQTTKLATRAKQAIWDEAFSGRMTAPWRGTEELITWRHVSCSEACEKVQSGGTPKKDGFCEDGGVPFLKVYNIVNQKVAFAYKPQFIIEEAHNTKGKKSKLKPGDVLMNIVGPPLGKVAVVPDTYSEWNCNQAITVFRPSKIVSTQWIYHFLCSGISVASVVRETRGVVGQVNISLTQCRNFVIPVPPVDEQAEIVRRIEAAFARIDRLTEEANRAAHLLDRLDERLLAKAFRGELVPQNPEDEPAEALLTRIRESRATAPKAKRGRKKKAAAE